MGECPSCVSMPLSGYEASPGVEVELCAECRGLYLDRHEIRELVGRGSLSRATDVVPVSLGEEVGMRCPKCVDPAMQPLGIKGAPEAGCWQCRACGGMWLADGAFFALARALRTSLPVPPIVRPMVSEAPSLPRGPRLTHSRSRFDEGLENLVAVPVVLLLSWWLCSGNFGGLLSFMVSMPFHELGHAAGSWLSSRIAIPFPFFTFWYDDQSILMGLIVAGVLGWLLFHTYREKNRFMFGSVSVVTFAWFVITFLVSPTRTLMWQILSGALGELVFAGFILIAFHFPGPDRFRWDFWRWVALIPAAVCFTHALMLWHGASTDVSQIPWGSALGSESDGDMNRLVAQFGWKAPELAGFYLNVGYFGVTALAAAYAYSAYRLVQRKRGQSPFSLFRR
ncbi:MAG: zf-TFIIB domain-containing protein [Polyangiales bacterium]